MGSRPPGPRLPILTSLLLIWQCSRGQPSYIIDTVGLTISPESTVQSGTPVMIRCQAVVSRSNISRLDHVFLITRDDIPVHSSNTTKDSVEYELRPARAADSGGYECRVSVGDKSKSSISHKLFVTGLQTPTLNLSNTEPYEGEEFVATCSAPEEKGLLTFWFYRRFRNGEPEMKRKVQTMDNFARPTLSFRLRDECFLSCEYEINLLSGIRRSNRSKEIQLQVKGLNIVPVINMVPSHSVYEGAVVEVVCKVVDSPLKDINLFLTKDRKILKKVTSTALSHRFTAQDGGSGELVCKAEWGNVQKNNNLSITVKQLFSKPNLSMDPVDLFEGDDFKMSCLVSIDAPDRISTEAMNFSIYKDDIRLSATHIYRAVAHSDTNGNYTCKVQVESLGLVKESPKMFVKAKIPVSAPLLSVVGGTMLLGKPFQLLCQSTKGTLPITYSLHGPHGFGTMVVTKPEEKAIFNTSAIFKITDLRKYLCHARNNKRKPPMIGSGHQLQHSTKIIEPVSKPILDILPDIEDISEGHNMTLVCSVEKGSPPINFTWFHTATEGPIASLTTNELKVSYKILNVRGEHGGSYYCVSTNLAKDLKQSHVVTVRVKLLGWKKGLIAVFSILLILSLILVVAFKTPLLHCKRKRTVKLSVKSAGTKVERLSLTEAEVNEAVNGTPGMMGKSLWSEHVSGSESDDQSSVIAPEKSEPQYTEVQIREGDPNKAPVNNGAETVYSEVCSSQQGVPEQADVQVSVEYAELNHDVDCPGDHGNYGNHSPDADHVTETQNSDNYTDD